jgi:hypothetical protein
MPGTFEFCLPASATSVPDHPVWLHEVKYDGLYEGHAVKKFFAISISSLPTFQEGSGERSSALMARQAPLLGRAERSTPGARRVAPEGARG